MKRYLFILFAATLLLGGCSVEEITSGEGGNSQISPELEEGTALLQFSFGHTQTATGDSYSPGEDPAHVAESEIRSIAFFVQTDDAGTPGQPGFKAGAFNRFFSHEAPGSKQGLHNPLADIGNGQYTASLLVRSSGFGAKTQLVAIANYVENDMTEQLMQVTSLDDIANLRTPEVSGNAITTPFLMVGTPTVDIPLSNQTVQNTLLFFDRLVSRIDVVNHREPAIDPELGFVLESAQVVHPAAYNWLIAKPANGATPGVLEAFAEKRVEGEEQEITGLYTYENRNEEGVENQTFVRINGRYWGEPITLDIPFYKPGNQEGEGRTIPLRRNYRYTIHIRFALDDNDDPLFLIRVSDWENGEVMDILPTVQTPQISEPDLTMATVANWDGAEKSYIFREDVPETLRFKITSLRKAGIKMSFRASHPAIIGLDGLDDPSDSDFLQVEKAAVVNARVEQWVELHTPELVDDLYRTPIKITLTFYDTLDSLAQDSLQLWFLPKYDQTAHYPVRVNGLHWAPVNVGATEVSGSTAISRATYGYHYQWGRNVPFDPEVTYWSRNTPIPYADAEKPAYMQQFITSEGDWVLLSDTEGVRQRDMRWSPEVNNSPCPWGWRLPTREETEAMSTRMYQVNQGIVPCQGDHPGQWLLFPAAGYRKSTDGKLTDAGTYALFWTSTMEYYLVYSFNYYWFPTYLEKPATGLPIRCVQEEYY
ncbi:hypothetical protein LJC38_03460 [Parabacteroides sp. OttesenSCG-928-K15]|nr:hypothetical protein [Parabacteroides sp. OttesenSCG-928-K15]